MRAALGGLGLVMGALLACGRGERATPSPTASALVSAALAPPPPVASVAVTDPTVMSSVAAFTGEKLSACVDVVFRRADLDLLLAKMAEGDAGAKALTVEFVVADDVKGYVGGADTLIGDSLNKALGAGAAKGLRPPGKPTEIPKPCGEQFAGRAVVASCYVVARPEASDAGVSFPVVLSVAYY